jgi:signal-transduction protein with cAMP-binding, CBS, and nucleotidyltransferase domain
MGVETILKRSELFGMLNVDEVNKISTFSSMKEFKAGESIFEHNQRALHCYVLMKGKVYLQLPANTPVSTRVSSSGCLRCSTHPGTRPQHTATRTRRYCRSKRSRSGNS